MELHKIIEENVEVMDTISRECNIPTKKLECVVSEVTPTLVSSIREVAKNEGEVEMFFDEFESDHFDVLLTEPEHLVEREIQIKGQDVLEHLLKSKEVSHIVAELVGKKAGVKTMEVEKILPMIASVLVGVLTQIRVDAIKRGETIEDITAILDENKDGMMWQEVTNRCKKWFK